MLVPGAWRGERAYLISVPVGVNSNRGKKKKRTANAGVGLQGVHRSQLFNTHQLPQAEYRRLL